MAVHPDILGKGWAFPFRFTSFGRVRKLVGVKVADGVDKVKMAIIQILGTKIGSRVIDRDFGSDTRGLIFTPIDQLSAIRLRLATIDAIQKWEKRVELLNVEVSLDRVKEGVLEIGIEFRIISTQVVGNLVYAFYISAEDRVQNQITIG